MRVFEALTIVALTASAACRAIRGPYKSVTTTSLLPAFQLSNVQVDSSNTTAAIAADDDFGSDLEDPWSLEPDDSEGEEDDPTLTPAQQEALWCKAKSRGVQLTKAMMLSDQEAAAMLSWRYTQSPWDGDLRPELRKWGCRDDFEKDEEVDKQCDFDKTHEMADAFKDLNVDPRSAGQGGPNRCFYVEHKDGPAVARDEDGELPWPEEQVYDIDGKMLQVTQAYTKVGINPVSGLVYFLHRQSPEDAATEHWGRKPTGEELPALRSSSDITWGMWNRVAAGSKNLNYFMSVAVVNPETQYIMYRALSQHNIAEIPEWPGKDFEFAVKKTGKEEPSESELLEAEAAFALLDSSNGIAAGYFIVQHRQKLGWKYIWKARIWMAGSGIWANPNMLFYVSDEPPFDGQEQINEQIDDLQIVEQRRRDLSAIHGAGSLRESLDGRNLIREHRVFAKL